VTYAFPQRRARLPGRIIVDQIIHRLDTHKVPQDPDRIMVPLGSALAHIDRMHETFYTALSTEDITARSAVSRVLAEDVASRANMPGYDTCTMDGYAVRSADEYPLKIIGEAYAGHGFRKIGKGEAVYVTTGARLPEGADAVLQVEHARVEGDRLFGIPLKRGKFVVRTGADLRAGEILLKRGTLIAPAMAGILLAGRVDRVAVYRKPRVAVIATGDEIRDGTVADANGPMACAMLESWGCVPDRLAPVGDDRDVLADVIEKALRDHDFAITIGGVSMGRKDFSSAVVADGEIVFKGVRAKPGKPFIASYLHGKPVFSLPGKPSGSYTALELFVRRFLLGEGRRRTVSVTLSHDVLLTTPGFDYLIFVELSDGRARPLGYEGSFVNLLDGPEYETSLLSTSPRTVLADGYFIAREPVKAGETVTVNLLN
jgi:molybdenum cofactor synthesis domain-containing protein